MLLGAAASRQVMLMRRSDRQEFRRAARYPSSCRVDVHILKSVSSACGALRNLNASHATCRCTTARRTCMCAGPCGREQAYREKLASVAPIVSIASLARQRSRPL